MTRTWTTVTERFEPVGQTFYKTVNCTVCGKRLRRQKRFEQTLNPFNRRNGRVKTRDEILEEEREKGRLWVQQAEMCLACQA